MANQIVGNIYIVDSVTGNNPLSWPGSPSGMLVMAIGFWAVDSSAQVAFSMGGNTSQVVCRFDYNAFGTLSSGALQSYFSTQFGNGVYFDQLAVPILRAGTAWIYFA